MNISRNIGKLMIAAGLILLTAGCSAMFVEEEEPYRGLVEDDVVAMSEAGVPPDIIIRKMEVSDSKFDIGTDDILRLKRRGVADEVINAMLNTTDAAREDDIVRGYALYEQWHNYYNTFYPAMLPYDRVFPTMYYNYGPFQPSRYRWSGEMGGYYMDLPVGMHRNIHKLYPRYYRVPGMQLGDSKEKKSGDK